MKNFIRFALVALGLLAATQAQAANRFWVPLTVTGAVSGTGSVCRLTVSPGTSGLVATSPIIVAGLVGATECNGTTTVSTVVDSTHIELTGTTFTTAYVSGGTVAGGIWSSSNTNNWSATTGGAGGASVPGSADAITLDANSGGGTVTVNTTVNTSGLLTCTAFTGTLDFSANNPTVTLGSFIDASTTAAPVVNGGTGLWTITSINAAPAFQGPTGTNFNFSSTPITFTPASQPTGVRSFFAGGQTYGAITISSNPSGLGFDFTMGFATGVTFASLSIGPGADLVLTNNVTLTLLATPAWAGTSSQLIFISTTLGNSAFPTMAIPAGAAPSLSWLLLKNIHFSGNTSGVANSSIDLGQNAGITINPPAYGGGGHIIGG